MTPDDPDSTLADLLAAYDDALANGDIPPAPTLDWPKLDPSWQARLEANRAILDLCERIWPRSRSVSLASSSTGLYPTPYTPTLTFPFDFGRFRARRKLGAGGCGVVFLADDPVLGRSVAIKVPRPDILNSPDLSRRFLREARAAALLAHPNIVPVYEASGANGICYIAAEYCPGPTLAGWLSDHPRPTPRAAAVIVAALADAMGYAHRRGVIHRDLKPSNVLLFGAGSSGINQFPPDPDATLDELIPKVTDFGFAKLRERDDDATRTGTVIGTPQYMAPEQAEGQLTAVGPATDVYALGAILYELLTGQPPIKGSSDADTLRRVLYLDPSRPRSLRPDCPRDLEAVCLKCLEKQPNRRYPDGMALADDLHRFLTGQPTKARPVSWGERLFKWGRRNPLPAIMIAVLTLAIITTAFLEAGYNRELSRQNAVLEAALVREKAQANELETQRRLAADRAEFARRQAYLAQIRYLGGLAAEKRFYEIASAWEPQGPARADVDLRGFEWHYLARLARQARVWRDFAGPVESVALSADGRRAAAYAAGDVRVWDTATGYVLARWPGLFASNESLALSPDGQTVLIVVTPVAGADRPKLVALDVATRNQRIVLDGVDTSVSALIDFLTDGRLLIPCENGLSFHNLLTGEQTPLCVQHDWKVICAATVPSESTLLAVLECHAHRYQAVTWDAKTGQAVNLPGVTDLYNEVRVCPNGRFAAFLRHEPGDVHVWDCAAGQMAAKLALEGPDAKTLSFLPDGRLVVAGWGEGDVASVIELGIWRPSDGLWTTRQIKPGCKVEHVAISSDGRRLLIGAADSTARLIDLAPPLEVRSWPAHAPAEAWALAFAPDGKTLVTGGDDHAVNVWEVRTGRRLACRVEHDSLVSVAAFAPDGQTFATASYDGTVKLWDATTYAVLRTIVSGGQLRCLAFAPSGDKLATAGGRDGGGVTVWEAATGRRLQHFQTPDRVSSIVFGSDGQTLIFGRKNGLHWGDVATGREIRKLETTAVSSLALSTDGQTLLVANEAGQVVFHDAQTGRERYRAIGPPVRLTAVAIAPNGKTLVSSGMDGAVRLWHANSGDELFPLIHSGPPIYRVAFSPDGSTLAAACHNGHVYVWPTIGR
jgi:WD40 repeat protein/tRNA A-37 threonylcarbamoyl transferase component Bud32